MWLKSGGNLVFSVEHPIFTANGNQDWYYDENGNIDGLAINSKSKGRVFTKAPVKNQKNKS